MSGDTIDDLIAAEDFIGEYALTALADYCRPSCNANGDASKCEAGDCCGCPCHG